MGLSNLRACPARLRTLHFASWPSDCERRMTSTVRGQLYNKEVVSLAVLCDDRPDWRPTTFAYGRWGCKMGLTFRSAKLIDDAQNVEGLEASDHLFAAVVLAHCKTIETRRDPESRRQWKLRIVK